MAWMLPHGNLEGGHMYLEEGFDPSEDNIKPKGRRRRKLLYKTVCEQMEFYFSDANLSKDRFLRQMVESDPYIPLDVFLKFNKINRLVSTVEEIAKAIKKSEILELSEDLLKVHRKTPVKIKENEDECTIYVENLPPEITHDELKKVFLEFGKVVYVSIPKYQNTRSLKGFAFVEFDTVQEAAETIRIFEEKGSCLSPHMLPEKLCSIRTFASDSAPDSSKSQVEKSDETKVDSSSDKEVSLNDSEKQNDSSTACTYENKSEQPSSKKRKLECDGDQNDDEKHASKKEKKSKNGEEKLIKEEALLEQNGTDVKEEAETSDNEESCTENKDDGSSEKKKKKKNRKKKKRPKERELFANGMVVLSKKEWKRLRNKYLNMQRVNMQRVKQQVLEARFMRRQPYTPHPAWAMDHGRSEEMRPPPPPIDAPKPRVTFVPGVIVCVKFNEPVVDVKGFKAEARTQPGVQYVDIHEGAFEAYLRCSGPSEAQHLLQINFWKNMSILAGPEESEYWDKISRDREAKLGKKVVVLKERGKKKLLRKAEIVKATHLHFDN